MVKERGGVRCRSTHPTLAKLTASDPCLSFGNSVSLNGGYIVIGAQEESEPFSMSHLGSVYVFTSERRVGRANAKPTVI